ncbi:MAG: thioredoxin family protein [Terriglobia bacterium]
MNRAFALALTLCLLSCIAQAAGGQIFDDHADAHRLIASAIAEASKSHKNIVLDFGANWCPDCHALHDQMQQGELAPIIAKSFLVVPIDVGIYNRNLDIVREYRMSLRKGIPALAILNSHGKLLYAMTQGQFSDAGSMSAKTFVEFFKKWEPKR